MTYILYINIYDMQKYSHHRNRMKASYLVKKKLFQGKLLMRRGGGKIQIQLGVRRVCPWGLEMTRMSGFWASRPTFQSICQEYSPVRPQPSDPSVSLGWWRQQCCYLLVELGTIAERCTLGFLFAVGKFTTSAIVSESVRVHDCFMSLMSAVCSA